MKIQSKYMKKYIKLCFDCLFVGSAIHMTNVCVLLASTFSPTPSHTQISSHIIQFQFVRNAPHCNMIFTYESKNQFVIKADILPKTSYIHLPKPVGNPKTMFYIWIFSGNQRWLERFFWEIPQWRIFSHVFSNVEG